MGVEVGVGQAQSYFESALSLFGKSEVLRLEYTETTIQIWIIHINIGNLNDKCLNHL